MTMEIETAKNIEAARREMVKNIKAALDGFTNETGIAVSSVCFGSSRAVDSAGENHATCYYDLTFDLKI
jgi:hypothetical protein